MAFYVQLLKMRRIISNLLIKKSQGSNFFFPIYSFFKIISGVLFKLIIMRIIIMILIIIIMIDIF